MKGSIRSKLILLFVFVGLIPLVIVGTISFFIYCNNTINVILDTASYNIDWMVKKINQYFQNVEGIISIGELKNVNHFLREEEDTYADSWELLSIFELYRNSLYDEESIYNITIIGLNGKCQSERDGYYHLNKNTIRRDPLFAAILDHNRALLQPKHIANYRKNETTIETIPLGQTILDTSTLDILGVIIIDIYPEEIDKYYRGVNGDAIGQIELLYNPEIKETNTPISILNIASLKEGLLLYKEINYEGWYLSYKISYEELIEPVKGVLSLTIIIFLFSIVFLVFVFFFISNKIIAPLNLLRSRIARAAEGDLTSKLDITTNDRVIGGLRNSFNKMVFDLKNLMTQKENEHKNYLQAHFRMLQQQINPHFLYNTLDTIIWMSIEKRNDDVIKLVESLSTFFRLNLSRGVEVISIDDTIRCINSYLSVQMMRYSDSLEYNINISDNLKKGRILKLILQPIVENALYHGI